jgi:hypothetical protein
LLDPQVDFGQFVHRAQVVRAPSSRGYSNLMRRYLAESTSVSWVYGRT